MRYLLLLIVILPITSLAQLKEPPFVLTIHCSGGWDTTMVFENKLDSNHVDTQPGLIPAEGKAGIPYLSHSSRPAVDTFFQNHGDLALIVNGVSSRSLSHKIAQRETTGMIFENNTASSGWWSFYGSQLGGALDIPHLSINAPYHPGTHSGFSTFINSEYISRIISEKNKNSGVYRIINQNAINKYINLKMSDLLEETLPASLDEVKQHNIFYSTAFEQILTPIIADFEFNTTQSQLVQDASLAIELMKSNKLLAAELQAGDYLEWDTHTNHFETQNDLFEQLFSDLNSIISLAKTAGIADKLTIIVQSEFGRYPKLNPLAGKDHWPFTSMLIWGKGIQTAQTLGSTNDFLVPTPVSPIFGQATGTNDEMLDFRHFMIALLHFYGIPKNLISSKLEPAYFILSEENQ